jgi:KipI family sensor histidine kinase inhibitor
VSSTPRVLPAGDSALVAEYGDAIDARVNARVRQLQRTLAASGHAGILELVPTYRSLMVHYDPMVRSHEAVAALVLEAAGHLPEDPGESIRTVEIPVLYGGLEGPDLGDVAARAGLRDAEVVGLHAAAEYVVFMIGFMPGFPYLGGLHPAIATPRLATPRTVVPAGSVGIAGAQTGIYPSESPGGWRIIGRTPVRLFDARLDPPALLQAGDHLRFAPVSRPEYDAIACDVEQDRYRPVVRVVPAGP